MYRSLVEVLRQHAATRPEGRLYTFLQSGDEESATRSFAELDQRARAIAAWLSQSSMTGKTVLLPIGDNMAFIDAFLGCLYGGVIAVPAAVPRRNRSLIGLQSIAHDAQVSGILCSSEDADRLQRALQDQLPDVRRFVLDDADGRPEDWSERAFDSRQLAFLQYTSGSTGTPKGVMVTHGNLIENAATIQHSMRLSRECRMISWLPLYHDMGLIGSVLQPLYIGFESVLMPPVAFLQKPVRWLNAISRYRATVSGAPDFAYALCVDRISALDRAGLDLSSWTLAYNGSEPVRADTIDRFVEAFAPAKFKRSAFYPCYGMAEHTLFISGMQQASGPTILDIGPTSLAKNEACPSASGRQRRRLVSCGATGRSMRVAIVDPVTKLEQPDGKVGEIWAKSASAAAGYFRKLAETEATFRATLSDTGEGPFLRTGDLGFMHRGQLFVTGRMKDVIIIRGRNHYPQDLEATAERCSRFLRKGGGVAVAIEQGGQTTLALALELTREGWNTADPNRVTSEVREAVAREHDLRAHKVLLLRPGSLPRTTSGKIRRSACRALIEAGACEVLTRADAEACVTTHRRLGGHIETGI